MSEKLIRDELKEKMTEALGTLEFFSYEPVSVEQISNLNKVLNNLNGRNFIKRLKDVGRDDDFNKIMEEIRKAEDILIKNIHLIIKNDNKEELEKLMIIINTEIIPRYEYIKDDNSIKIIRTMIRNAGAGR